jgi:hypothetical protein
MLALLDSMAAALKEVADVAVVLMAPVEKRAALVVMSRVVVS